MKNTITWFEIPVSDMSRAKKFYEEVLDTQLTDMPMPGIEMMSFPMEPGSVSGTLVKHDNYQPSMAGTRIYFDCDDITGTLGRAESAGASIVMPKTDIGDNMGHMAMFTDTEGNIVALHQPAQQN